MKLAVIVAFLTLGHLAVPQVALCQTDVTKTGPLSRKVTKEDKAGILQLFKNADAAWKKGDLQALHAFYDFPIYMGTDNQKGVYEGGEWSPEVFDKIMGPMMKEEPKGVTYKESYTPHFLSDDIAVVLVDTAVTQNGKAVGSYKSSVVVIKKNGSWRIKSGLEAGHGGQ